MGIAHQIVHTQSAETELASIFAEAVAAGRGAAIRNACDAFERKLRFEPLEQGEPLFQNKSYGLVHIAFPAPLAIHFAVDSKLLRVTILEYALLPGK